VTSPISERALILAPWGRDGKVAEAILEEAGIQAMVCSSLPELLSEAAAGAGIAVVTDEALRASDLNPLSAWLADQPPWSDFPFVLLTERGGGYEKNPAAVRDLERLGNVTFVERPFHPTTLVSLARSALRGRRRQYDARTRLEELHESERQIRTLANSIPTLCWMAKPDGHIFWYNQQWYDYTGTKPADMEGWGWRSVHDPETLPAVIERWGESLATGQAFEMVFPLRGADGRYRPFLTRVQPFRDADGVLTRWFGTNTDISVQQQAEQSVRSYAADLENRVAERTAELQTSERRLRTMFETSFMFQCLITPEGVVADANAASLEAIASERKDVVGKLLWETPWVSGTPRLITAARERFARIADGETLRRELTVNLPSGPRTFDLSLRPMYGEADNVVAVVMEAMDITEHRQAEEALRQSQKLEAIGQLTGGVAHDFNNLLMPMIGALDILQRRYAGKILDDRAASLIDGAVQSAERAKVLVQRLLGFARRQALDTRAVDIADLLEGMRELVRSSIGSNIQLRIVCAPDLPPAMADRNQLELAVLNLCVNARDSMPAGGDLLIDVHDETVGPGFDGADLKPGRYLRLSVIDSGKGMDAETLARAVEPFFSTKPLGQGTGLGLSMVHGLVAQLGGGFTLGSSPGEGTTASLYLPVADSAAAVTEREHGRAPALTDRPLSILLVDDDDLVRNGAAEMLRDLGHTVTEAPGGLEALARVEGGLPFDLLITDYKMPRMNGAELARKVRVLRPNTPILLITGYTGGHEDAPEFTRLTKPFRQADLAKALTKIAA
jgi:PAS domain S-box-containing protein